METATEKRIPPEVYQFFSKPGGHSLIVRGDAGTGKTTLALQIIEEISAVDRSFYHSTRVSDRSLLSQFSWLKDHVWNAERSDRLTGDIQVKDGISIAGGRSGLSDLKGIGISPMECTQEGSLSITIGKDMGELEGIYQNIEERLPERSLLVIDSIDALAEKYGLTCAKLLNTIQYDIVEVYGSNVLFVVENGDAALDYLGDGVINLRCSEFNRRRLRELEILKLRGCEIQQPRYIFTLDGGRIRTFGYHWARDASVTQTQWKPIGDLDGRISTGISDIDRFLGGLEEGSIALIELGHGVPATVSGAIEASLVSNFAIQRRGVLWVPMRKASAEGARSRTIHTVPTEYFDQYVRIPEKADQMAYSNSPYVMPIEGSDAFSDFKWQNVEYALSNAERPILALMGLDTMQSMYGSGLDEQLMDFLAQVRRQGGIFVALSSPSVGSVNARLSDLSTTRLRIERVGGTILLYGEEPFTECYAWHFKNKGAGGDVSLTPIL